MTKSRLPLALVVLPLLFAGCRCGPGVQDIPAVLAVSPNALDFGEVKLGDTAELPVKLSAQVNAPVSITGVTVEGASAAAFEVISPVSTVEAQSDATVRLRFAPTARQGYEATLVISSNDQERPQIRVPVTGEGAVPQLSVVPECATARSCRGSAQVTPPAIDFGEEPFSRAVPLPVLEQQIQAYIAERKKA